MKVKVFENIMVLTSTIKAEVLQKAIALSNSDIAVLCNDNGEPVYAVTVAADHEQGTISKNGIVFNGVTKDGKLKLVMPICDPEDAADAKQYMSSYYKELSTFKKYEADVDKLLQQTASDYANFIEDIDFIEETDETTDNQ